MNKILLLSKGGDYVKPEKSKPNCSICAKHPYLSDEWIEEHVKNGKKCKED